MKSEIEETGFGTPEVIENCRAMDIGVSQYAECLRAGPNACEHAVPFGYCFLCHHPRVGEIVEQTEHVRG